MNLGHARALAHALAAAAVDAGATDWGKGLRTLNELDGRSWLLLDQAARTFNYADGGNGMPFSADTVEFAGGTHYNGHPTSRTIGHWISAYSYSGSGSTISWADSSTTVYPSAARTFSYSSSSFATFLQSNGIAY